MAINGFRADGEVYRYNASALEGDVAIPDGSVTLDSLASGVIDDTLAVDGAAADAKATGDAIGSLNDRYSQLVTWVSGGGTPVRTGFQLFSIKHNSFAVQIDFVTDEATWSEDSIIATIDTAYRPPFNVQFLGYVYDSNVPTQLSVGLDGKLRIYGKTGYTSKRLRGHVFYVYA